MRILAGGSCEMRESPAECVRVGNYVVIMSCLNALPIKVLNFMKAFRALSRKSCNPLLTSPEGVLETQGISMLVHFQGECH